MLPILYIIIPCYNEEEVLPITSKQFLNKIKSLIEECKINENSKILFVDDGSKDQTWNLIKELSNNNKEICAIQQSRNRGHQNAVLAGLMEIKDMCDISISIDCDGQDDINAIDEMLEQYKNGFDIVYGVRKNRKKDSFFKRITAQGFYKLLNLMGVECIYNHADYRLASSRVLKELANFKEVNLFLRGMFPMVGFKATTVYYDREERLAGKSHYPLRKMLGLATDGITSLSITPIRIITNIGMIVSLLSFIGILWCITQYDSGNVVQGWTSTCCIICFLSGIQIISMGVIGEYIGKIYLETKQRPRYIISEKINLPKENKNDRTKNI